MPYFLTTLSSPNLDKLITLYNGGSDLGRLITRLSGIAPNSEWLDIRVKNKIVSLQSDSRIIDWQDSLSGPYTPYLASSHNYER